MRAASAPSVVGELDEQVELRGGDLEVVAEARVPFAEERAERASVRPARRLERADACAYAFVLGDDVAQPAARDLVDARGRAPQPRPPRP